MVTHNKLKWPQSFATVFRHVLPEQVLEAVKDEAETWAKCPNYWVPKADILGSKEARTPAEKAIRALYWQCMRPVLDENFAGAEWWVQVYKRGQGLAFHFDKDETLYKKSGDMKHPVHSSILYLTGTATEGRRLGPTVIIDQQFENEGKQPVPDHPERCALIWPRMNSLAVFDGRLGHGVLDSASSDQRITMLINWWSYQPQAVNVMPLSPADGANQEQDSELKAAHPVPAEDDGNHALEISETAKTPSVAVAVVKAPPGEEGAVFTVDNIMEGYGLSCAGKDAVDVVAIEHPGYHLYPVAADDEQIQDLVTAAALVFWSPEDSSESDS